MRAMEACHSPSAGPPADAEHWLALCRAPGVGPRLSQVLLERFGSVRDACHARARDLAACGLPPAAVAAIRRPDADRLRQDMDWLAAAGHHLVVRGDAAYPPLLAATVDAPFVVFVAGDPALLVRPQIAVVGTRRPSATGVSMARELGRDLGRAGLVVTSGLALGVDAAAHAGALEAGAPTIAVLGCGIDLVYPRRHRELAARIERCGLLVSEFPPGVAPLARHFPRRNRIISGLSLGVLVVEAARRSGSLITARLAAEQGRDVFAVPGSVRNPMCAGTHTLLREGAALVEGVDDVLAELQPGLLPEPVPREPPASAPPLPETGREEARVLSALGYEAATLDDLAERTALTTRDLLGILLRLEIQGRVSARPGGTFERSDAPGPEPSGASRPPSH